ncbi:MAG TPA: ParB/RepB/Spo0J family partition protein [Usitatibacter sp.]|jgi:ParB family transcriptional regulator, chromosome partitioning protein|nr:ParB/RepB/Spo0J family partition protein [Usitatibacter sp.]
MTVRAKGLGRGLDALLGGNSAPREREELAQLPVAALRPGKYQPRTRMDEASLAELADSIRSRGVIQPVIVRPVGGEQYEILAGERRWRAARIAGLERLPAVVREVPDEAALGIGLIENIQREDLSPLEEASGLKRLIEEFHLTHEQVAAAIGRSRVGVTNLLRLLELATPVQAMLQDGKIDMGHARALLALSRARQVEIAEQVIAKRLSVRETERLVQQATQPPPASRNAATVLDADGKRLQEELAEALGASVQLRPRGATRGSVVIDYSSLDELQGLVKRLKRG